MRKLLYKLTAWLRCRLIKIEDRPYLERYYLGQLFGVTFYLHRFVAPDGDRHVHDHPWLYAASIVLAGEYREEWVRWLDLLNSEGWRSIYRRVRWFNWIPGHRFHRIADAQPETWTLFMHTERVKGWGFIRLRQWPTREGETSDYRVEYKPHPSGPLDWHLTAPLGKDAGRAPMP